MACNRMEGDCGKKESFVLKTNWDVLGESIGGVCRRQKHKVKIYSEELCAHCFESNFTLSYSNGSLHNYNSIYVG